MFAKSKAKLTSKANAFITNFVEKEFIELIEVCYQIPQDEPLEVYKMHALEAYKARKENEANESN